MSDAARELTDLRREVQEARHQAIKTDNQVKNVAIDVKGFEKRFESLERRTRVAALGVYVLFALGAAAAATIVVMARDRSWAHEVDALGTRVKDAEDAAQKAQAALDESRRTVEQNTRRQAAAEEAAGAIIEALDGKRDRDAIDLLPRLDSDDLTGLGRRMVDKRVAELRKRAAEAAYKSGRAFLAANQKDQGVKELARALKLEPDGPYAEKSRYFQAIALYDLKRYDQAEPLLRDLRANASDHALEEEVRYLLGITLARLGKRDEARTLLQELAAGRFGAMARGYLASLDTGGPFPGDPKKPPVKAGPETAAAATPTP